MEPTQVKKTSNEFFVMVNGEKCDSALHEEILAGDHADATKVGIEQARKCGLTEKEIQLLYPDDDTKSPESDPGASS
jgi:hypothetical protein